MTFKQDLKKLDEKHKQELHDLVQVHFIEKKLLIEENAQKEAERLVKKSQKRRR